MATATASSLPKDVLLKRVKHEIRSVLNNPKLKVYILREGNNWEPLDRDAIESIEDIPIWLFIRMNGVPGPVNTEKGVGHRYKQEFMIKITRNYPFEKPVVRWQSEIFHPNIMPPEEGGMVCTKLLDNWGFRSTLAEFIKGIEALLIHPNPSNPYGTESCTLAAEYFNTREYRPPVIEKEERRGPRIISDGG